MSVTSLQWIFFYLDPWYRHTLCANAVFVKSTLIVRIFQNRHGDVHGDKGVVQPELPVSF